jgi:phage terminase small subunit
VALNKKQARFVEEYPLDCNGTRAAIRAGYSPKTAQEQASQLLSKLIIREAIDDAIRARGVRTHIDADWVVANFRNLHLEALAAKDYSAAARCLEALAKHTGAFREHNKQKHYTPEEIESIKRRLEEYGMDFTCRNAPPGLYERLNGKPHPGTPPGDN